MSFTVMVWNVEKFKATNLSRIRTVADHIRSDDPDVFCLLEFMGKSSALRPAQKRDAARRLISEFFPRYDFGLTDSKKRIEILVGWKVDSFAQVLYTQRREFDPSQRSTLRPGALLSVREFGSTSFHNLLFLHLDMGRDAQAFQNRSNMFRRIVRLKNALQQIPIQNGNAQMIALGDLNTMGRSGRPNAPSVSAAAEITQMTTRFNNGGMSVLTKAFDRTFSNASGSRRSPLDHGVASNDLTFQQFTKQGVDNNPFEIDVRGWVDLTGNARRSFINNISDHCSLTGEVI
jgi:endonuclease/exonuclease/phosphatase family metal-dependent hydrolase